MNELLLIISLIVVYGSILLFYQFFGEISLYAFSAIATILANIEVLLIINAFGMEMTLGNILFASTFIITDILSENHGRKKATLAVKISLSSAIFLILLSQIWLHYLPSKNGWAYYSFHVLFTNTIRMVTASISVFAISQIIDVFLYHKCWHLTANHFTNNQKFLWLRNNGSTLISQMINAILFNTFAFYGIYDNQTLISLILSTYVISIFTSLLDTPVVYIARHIYQTQYAKTSENKIIEKQ